MPSRAIHSGESVFRFKSAHSFPMKGTVVSIAAGIRRHKTKIRANLMCVEAGNVMQSHSGCAGRVRRRDFLRIYAAAATGAAGIGVGAHPSRVRAAASSASSLIVGSNFDIKTLDPGRELEEGTNNVAHVTYDQLVTFHGEDLKTPRPSLATGWTISDDGRAYTFRLRSGVRFASGSSLTSADVKWSLDRLMNIKGNA